MGDFEIGRGEDEIAVEQDVQVEGARAVGEAGGAVTAEVALDGQQLGEQPLRIEFRLQSDDGIDEARLRGKAHRLSGVKRRAGGEAAQGLKAQRGRGERGWRWTSGAGQVGTHPDVGGRHWFQSTARVS